MDRRADFVPGGHLTQMVKHHGPGKNCRQGIGDPLARDIGCGAMNRLKHTGELAFGIYVGACGKTDGARDHGGKVREDVAKKVAGHHNIKCFGFPNKVHGRRIHQ